MALEGKVVLVTGGSGGIGRAIALACASAGADVAVTYRRNASGAEAVAEEIRALGRRVESFRTDVSREDEVAGLATAVGQRFGRVDAVKVKVAEHGQSLDDDAARVGAVRAVLPEAAIRVDANGGWDVPAAVEALTRLAGVGLEYAEQPVPSIEGLAEVRSRLRDAGTPVLIAADESVRKESDPLRVARAGAGTATA